jgi:hypothetical protein
VEGEECDDGVLGGVDGCTDKCKLLPDYYCREPSKPCNKCSLETPAEDATATCEEANATLTRWLRNNLDAEVDAHPSCAGANFQASVVSSSGQPQRCGSTVYMLNATFPKGTMDTSVASFTVTDTVPPTLRNVPKNTSVMCDAIPSNEQVAADDNCKESVEITVADRITPGSCDAEWTIVRTWTATDTCMNSANVSTVYRVVDTVKPVIVALPTDLLLECDGTTQMDQIQPWLDRAGGAQAQDNCKSRLSWTHNFEQVKGSLVAGCSSTGVANVTFTATDDCGNVASASATISRREASGRYARPTAAPIPGSCRGSR